MTRILYWNINNFSINKILDPTDSQGSADRLRHIVNEVLLPSNAHIFVIVEVYARQGEVGLEGKPIVDNAQVGVYELLRRIRVATNNAHWMLVPPVWSGEWGFCEGIAVFYDSSHLQFVGPYVYGPDYRTATQTRSGAWHTPPNHRACPFAETTRPAGAPANWPTGAQDYPPLYWPDNLPNRLTPLNFNLPSENRLAGRYEFYDVNGARLYFPAHQHRSPFLTQFVELPLAHPHPRQIKLFSLHTSPGTAGDAVAQLQHIPELAAGANEVSVVLGDFNVDTFDNRADYNGLENLGFTLHFDSEYQGAVNNNRRPYCLTHFLPTAHATPFGILGGVVVGPTHNVYPRFGYMGAMAGMNFQTPGNAGAIDNVLTHYGANAVAPANHNATIVNTVVGKPYDQANPTPQGVTAELTGGIDYNSSLNSHIPLPDGDQDFANIASRLRLRTFQQWNNFERIRSTSDHLALVIDV